MKCNFTSQIEHLLNALKCAEEGFPLIPVSKEGWPLTARGFKDATTNVRQIAEWWAKWPDADIGVVIPQDACQKPSSSSQASSLLSIDSLLKTWEN
jgi:hypothetical protein